MCPRANAQQQLALYKDLTQGFAAPKRNYDALVLTATKRLSHNFLLLASYTYSRTVGNYPGLFQASNGQLDPNISTQYDLRELLVNRDGPLPNDRPHNLKLQGSYFVPFGRSMVVLGAAFNAFSGSPIEVLGAHPSYGRLETYVLPRGSGGRTPFYTQVDLHVSYRRQLSPLFAMEAYWDVFNVANQSAVVAVDQRVHHVERQADPQRHRRGPREPQDPVGRRADPQSQLRPGDRVPGAAVDALRPAPVVLSGADQSLAPPSATAPRFESSRSLSPHLSPRRTVAVSTPSTVEPCSALTTRFTTANEG